MSNDSNSIAALTPSEYLKERVDYKIAAYTKKGQRYRFGYIAMASSAAIAAATVPVLINRQGVSSTVPTLLSLLVTILVGLEGILHFREHWKNYDLMKSFLRQESLLYRAAGGPYRGQPDPVESFRLFVERIEEEISKERAQTIQMRTTQAPDREKLERERLWIERERHERERQEPERHEQERLEQER